MSLPTKDDTYMRLIEHLRLGQEAAAMLMHLNNEDGTAPGQVLARGWFHVSEGLKKMQYSVTQLATGKLYKQ